MKRWHEDIAVMKRRWRRQQRQNSWWARREKPLGWYRKNNPYAHYGCRCTWCRPEQMRSRQNEKYQAIRDEVYHWEQLLVLPHP